MMTTGSIIQKFRERKNLSRDQVAAHLAVSKKTYDRIEQNERDLSLTEASALSELFDVPLEMLIGGKGTFINHGHNVSVISGYVENFVYDSKMIEELKDDLKKLHDKLGTILGSTDKE